MRARVTVGAVAFHCPACNGAHRVERPRWRFSGDENQPTIHPSIDISHPAKPEDGIPAYRCHSIVSDGRIQFGADSTHALAGKTVDLPEWT